jgi:hypothetical protein
MLNGSFNITAQKNYNMRRETTDLHVLKDLEEGEGHTATNDHLVDLVQHVLNQLNLVRNFGSVTF